MKQAEICLPEESASKDRDTFLRSTPPEVKKTFSQGQINRGHFKVVCRSATAAKSNTSHRKRAEKSIGSIIAATQKLHAPKIEIEVEYHGQSFSLNATPDTGADISAAGLDIHGLLNDYEENLLESKELPAAVDGHKLHPVGMTFAKISLGNREVKEEIHFLKGMKGLVLSWETVQKLGIIPEDYPKQLHSVSGANEIPSVGKTTESFIPPIVSRIPRPVASKPKTPQVHSPTKDDFIKEFQNSETFKIELTEEAIPHCVINPRPVPFEYKEPLKKELDKLQASSIITLVTKPTEWCLHSVVAPKRNGEIQLCIDFRPLNKFVKHECYQMTTPATAVAEIEASQANTLRFRIQGGVAISRGVCKISNY